MEKKYDIITALDTCVDIILYGKDTRPEYGQKEKLIDDYSLEMGGSACIFACQAAKLGLKTAGIGLVGEDTFGSFVLDKLTEANVDVSNIQIDLKNKTGVGVLLSEANDRAILTYPGTITGTGLENHIFNLLQQTKHLHISSFFLMDGLRPYYSEITKEAKKQGVTISLDTNWDPAETWDRGLKELLPLIDILFLNENELKAITGMSNINEAAASLHNYDMLLTVKMGGDGAKLYTKDNVFYAPAHKTNVIDTIGAGDSFDAGFLYGFLNNLDLELCLKIGVYCGSMNTRGQGGTSTQAKYDDLRKDNIYTIY